MNIFKYFTIKSVSSRKIKKYQFLRLIPNIAKTLFANQIKTQKRQSHNHVDISANAQDYRYC
jgi:hypothetical protein